MSGEASIPPPSKDRPGGRFELALTVILALELLAFGAAKLPAIARFECFYFQDYGANLTVQALLDQGVRPTIDFFYPYGLLPLALGRAWFVAWGRTPWAYLAAIGVIQVAIAWGLARVVSTVRGGFAGTILVVAAVPIVLPPSYPNLAHGLEAALLIHALAEQARGSMRGALMLATVALTVKPSMAYVYGAWLVVALLVGILRRRLSWREARPAAALGAALLAWLALGFGPEALVRSLLPTASAGQYRASGYGFFRGTGREFWWPRDAALGHYLATPRLFWLVATLALMSAAAIVVVRATRRRTAPDAVEAVTVTCAILHVAFVALFFGNAMSWQYYAYLLPIGLLPVTSWSRAGRFAVVAIALLALAVDRTLPRELEDGWRGLTWCPEGGGLLVQPDVIAEWRGWRRRMGPNEPGAILSFSGAAEVLEPGLLLPPVGIFLMPGLEDGPDAARHAGRLSRALMVLIPRTPIAPEFLREVLARSVPIREALNAFPDEIPGRYFTVYQVPLSDPRRRHRRDRPAPLSVSPRPAEPKHPSPSPGPETSTPADRPEDAVPP